MSKKQRVLIVDDHPKNVKLLEAHLAQSGYETFAAYDGEQALLDVAQVGPDLILLDAMMPKLDGFEVCRRLKNAEATRLIPIIMVTALDQLDDKVRGIEAGADDFLTKPVNRQELLARTKALLKTKRLNDQVLSLQRALTQLIEITTFTERFAARQTLLNELSRRTAELTGAACVAVTFIDEQGRHHIEAGHNLEGGEALFESAGRQVLLADLLRHGAPFYLPAPDAAACARYDLAAGYAGVPLKALSGSILGFIHAFGLSENLQHDELHLLEVVAQRLSYELQLKDYNQQLEVAIDQRTSDLKKALDDLRDLNETLVKAQSETIFRLAKAAEYRDEDTAEHLYRISGYARLIAECLHLPANDCENIALAAIMHDVGKIGTPDSILLKRGALTPEEYQKMKEHTLIGAKILGGSNSTVLQMSEEIAINHHEKFDGSGYPHGLKGNDIPISARIVAVADVFDALTTERVYKRAFSVEEALTVLRENSGTHFDPDVLGAFLTAMPAVLKVRESLPGRVARQREGWEW